MNLKLRALERVEEAHSFSELLERGALESSTAYREDPIPEGTIGRFLTRSFDRPQTLILVAEADGKPEPQALCVTGPFSDPLTAEETPLILALYVSPTLRHRGIARAMVREASRLLAARGMPDLAARAAHNDDALISMGERWGFVRDWELMLFEG